MTPQEVEVGHLVKFSRSSVRRFASFWCSQIARVIYLQLPSESQVQCMTFLAPFNLAVRRFISTIKLQNAVSEPLVILRSANPRSLPDSPNSEYIMHSQGISHVNQSQEPPSTVSTCLASSKNMQSKLLSPLPTPSVGLLHLGCVRSDFRDAGRNADLSAGLASSVFW